ncbi:MAG: hypothetical protein JST50_00650 [Bacteroidetes bacterium]|jgi:hypothetical protein|nr:hypothetical protein [Bacteroidota bacterium]
MWIEITSDIFETKDSKSFYFIFNLLTWNPSGSVARYNIYTDSRDVSETENYQNLNTDDKKLLDDEFDAYITSNGKIRYTITNNNKGNYSFNLDEAIRFFIQPASIILENNKNDAAFIQAIVHHFEARNSYGAQALMDHINNGWIQFENAGGCSNVENFIEGKLQSFNDLSVKNNAYNYKYVRCMVILDSDKEYSGEGQKPGYTKLESYLISKNLLNYHFLEKRMMENYMPDEVIESLRNNKTVAWINVYNILNDEQKNFLNYKSGFSKEKDEKGIRKPLKAEISALYAISKANFDILDNGLNYPNFKENFPALFLSSGHVNKFTLKTRAGNDELERVLDKMKSLI